MLEEVDERFESMCFASLESPSGIFGFARGF